jgi:hypothetical protein
MLGLFTEFTPKFVKRYHRLGDEIRAAARENAEEVRQGRCRHCRCRGGELRRTLALLRRARLRNREQ